MNDLVLVTGGSRGIGLACAKRFASLGDRVAVTYNSSAPPPEFDGPEQHASTHWTRGGAEQAAEQTVRPFPPIDRLEAREPHAAIDDLIQRGMHGQLPDETAVVYVSPLKALNHDIARNLEVPLAAIAREEQAMGHPLPEIEVGVRTGDTPSAERARHARRPPHVMITTPESLYLLLTSSSASRMFATTRAVIVDEIHTLVGTKRGAHLALSLERLEAMAAVPPQRIGLSATVREPSGEANSGVRFVSTAMSSAPIEWRYENAAPGSGRSWPMSDS